MNFRSGSLSRCITEVEVEVEVEVLVEVEVEVQFFLLFFLTCSRTGRQAGAVGASGS